MSILYRLIMELAIKEIAKYMQIFPRTVETYINNLKNKLGVEKRSQLGILIP